MNSDDYIKYIEHIDKIANGISENDKYLNLIKKYYLQKESNIQEGYNHRSNYKFWLILLVIISFVAGFLYAKIYNKLLNNKTSAQYNYIDNKEESVDIVDFSSNQNDQVVNADGINNQGQNDVKIADSKKIETNQNITDSDKNMNTGDANIQVEDNASSKDSKENSLDQNVVDSEKTNETTSSSDNLEDKSNSNSNDQGNASINSEVNNSKLEDEGIGSEENSEKLDHDAKFIYSLGSKLSNTDDYSIVNGSAYIKNFNNKSNLKCNLYTSATLSQMDACSIYEIDNLPYKLYSGLREEGFRYLFLYLDLNKNNSFENNEPYTLKSIDYDFNHPVKGLNLYLHTNKAITIGYPMYADVDISKVIGSVTIPGYDLEDLRKNGYWIRDEYYINYNNGVLTEQYACGYEEIESMPHYFDFGIYTEGSYYMLLYLDLDKDYEFDTNEPRVIRPVKLNYKEPINNLELVLTLDEQATVGSPKHAYIPRAIAEGIVNIQGYGTADLQNKGYWLRDEYYLEASFSGLELSEKISVKDSGFDFSFGFSYDGYYYMVLFVDSDNDNIPDKNEPRAVTSINLKRGDSIENLNLVLGN